MRPYVAPIIVLLLCTSAYPAPPSSQETEVYTGLLGWAAELSGYQRSETIPMVEFVPQEFFRVHACGGVQCRVWGWYPNTGKDIVYVHEAVRELIGDGSDPRSLIAASILVHEFTHYLQAAERGFGAYECEEALELEREAYKVQNAYIAAYGRFMPVGASMHNVGCAGSASELAVSPSP
jgi:hypothetical protein